MKTYLLIIFSIIILNHNTTAQQLAYLETRATGIASIHNSSFESEDGYEIRAKEAKLEKIRNFVENNIENISKSYLYVACNENDRYYSRDTIKMHQIESKNYTSLQCCKFIEWNMVADAQFVWSDLSLCNAKTNRSYYTITNQMEVVEVNGSIFIKILRNGLKIDAFKVVGIDEVPSRYKKGKTNKILILVREGARES